MARAKTRRAGRVTINREFGSVAEFIHEYVSNVSSTGAFIQSKDPLPVGTRVNLKFSIILDELETVEGIGEVVRVEKHGMGVVFRELTPTSQKILTRLMEHVPDEDTPLPAPLPSPPAGSGKASASRKR